MVGKVWLLPIEPFEERYTEQWYRWWPEALRARGFAVEVVDGRALTQTIETGQFLDAFSTHAYKASQTEACARLLRDGAVSDDDVFLLLDAWTPTITALAYMRDVAQCHFGIVGVLHAGTWDPADLLAQRDLTRWAQDVERGWLRALDAACVATHFHYDLIARHLGDALATEKVRVTGLPLLPEFVTQHPACAWEARERLVLFPHRLAPEKRPSAFNRIREAYERQYGNDATWVRTKDVATSKHAYYELLGSARVAVSTARQETWGIAMQEAAALGCYPVVPRALSYSEVFAGSDTLYTDDDFDAAARCVRRALDADVPYALAPSLQARADAAFDAVADVIRTRGRTT